MSAAGGGDRHRSAARRFGLIGRPVGHSVSPAMMRAAFDALDLPHTYDAIDVAGPSALALEIEALRAGERAGLNVTSPHKRAVLSLADRVGRSAERAGAANVLIAERGRIRAENTDADAIVRVLGPSLESRRWALILGGGGAARAALVACEALGFEGARITSRSWVTSEAARAKGAELPDVRLRVEAEPWIAERGAPSAASARDVDLIVQATSAGMLGADPGESILDRVPWGALGPRAVAFDAVYRPRVTPFLDVARRSGLRAVDGLGMLVEQGALALTLWLGVEAPRDAMRRAAEEALTGAAQDEGRG